MQINDHADVERQEATVSGGNIDELRATGRLLKYATFLFPHCQPKQLHMNALSMRTFTGISECQRANQ